MVAAGGSGDRNPSGKPRPAGNPPKNVKHDTSPPLRTMKPKPYKARTEHEEHELPTPQSSRSPDQVVQSSAATGARRSRATTSTAWPSGSLPPDPNGAAGSASRPDRQQSFQVFSKAGRRYTARSDEHAVDWLRRRLRAQNDGDATAAYDRLADRWVISSSRSATGPRYYQCIAVSTTWTRPTSGTATRSRLRQFPYYPKLAVWPDAYYRPTTCSRCASGFTRARGLRVRPRAMLAGDPATQHCYVIDRRRRPAPVRSRRLHAASDGAPNYILGLSDAPTLNEWHFHVDWAARPPATS